MICFWHMVFKISVGLLDYDTMDPIARHKRALPRQPISGLKAVIYGVMYMIGKAIVTGL